MENREKQINLLTADEGNNRREKVRTIPITYIDPKFPRKYTIHGNKLKKAEKGAKKQEKVKKMRERGCFFLVSIV